MNLISLCLRCGALVGSGLAFGITLAVSDPTEDSEAGNRTALTLSVHLESLVALQHDRNLAPLPALGIQLELRY